MRITRTLLLSAALGTLAITPFAQAQSGSGAAPSISRPVKCSGEMRGVTVGTLTLSTRPTSSSRVALTARTTSVPVRNWAPTKVRSTLLLTRNGVTVKRSVVTRSVSSSGGTVRVPVNLLLASVNAAEAQGYGITNTVEVLNPGSAPLMVCHASINSRVR